MQPIELMIKHSLFLTLSIVSPLMAETSLTIYNSNLGVVRESLPMKLEAGENRFSFSRATAQVQPASVVLRDPAGNVAFSILEQGYRNDPVSRSLLLKHFEGQTISFRKVYPDGKVEEVEGKIIRSGHVPGGRSQDPIIEVDGKMRFQLPGEPLFPALGDDSILQPTLSWVIGAPKAAEFDAQLSYLSHGFTWKADYNFVVPETSEVATMTGWVTVENKSGTAFREADVKLVAGDVNIIEPMMQRGVRREAMPMAQAMADRQVEQKAFDGFHLYSLPRPLTIRDKETKQVEFLRAPQVKASKKYVYDGAKMFSHYSGRHTNPLGKQEFPTDVAMFWEFTNDEESGLGVPLPAGRVRFYRVDDADGNLEFVGENNIDHTPRNEDVSLYTGNAFDLVGERKITDFKSDDRRRTMSESVEVTVKNRSKEAKTIIVREHLWRWANWEVREASDKYERIDVDTIEFSVALEPDQEKTVSYTAHYSW